MWTIFVVLGVAAAVLVLVVMLFSRRPRAVDPSDQPPTEEATGHLPAPGADEVPRRASGSLMPGSEEYRNRDGKS